MFFLLPLIDNNDQVPENTPDWIEHHELIAIMRIVNTTTVNLQESLRRLVTLGGDPLLRKHTERRGETTGCYWVYVHSASRVKQQTNYF